MCFSQDVQRLVTCASDKTVRIWDVLTEEQMHLVQSEVWVNAVVFIPNSTLVAYGDERGRVHLWDVQSGQHIRALYGEQFSIQRLACSNNGRWLASASDECLCIWSLADFKVHRKHYMAYPIRDVTFSPNSKFVALATGAVCYVWTVEDGVLRYILDDPSMQYVVEDAHMRHILRHNHMHSTITTVRFIGGSSYMLATCRLEDIGAEVWDLRAPFQNNVLAALARQDWRRFFRDRDGDNTASTRVLEFM